MRASAKRPYDRLKRLLDMSVAAVLLVLLSPVVGLTAVVVLASMGRPILFRQVRPGRDRVCFELVKFRTMRTVKGLDGPDSDAVRLTRVGRWLRATSLDELPTLYNVVRGQMSLVGPRPLLVDYLNRYTPRQDRRHEVLPGVTGLAQVRGRNALTWDEKLEYDVRYVEDRSLRGDLRILVDTVRTVTRREGISADGHATMPVFAPAEPERVTSR